MRIIFSSIRFKIISNFSPSFIFVVLLVFTSLPALTQSSNKLNEPHLTVVSEILPPYQYEAADGSTTGFAIELVKAVLKEAKFSSNINIYPWARTFKLASENKNVLIFSLARIPEREANFHWIGIIHQEKYVLLKLKSKELNIKTLEDAKTHTVAVAKSSVGDHLLTELGFKKLEKSSEFEQSVKMVLTGRTDLVIVSDQVQKHNTNYPALMSKDLEQAFSLVEHSSSLYIAMSKDSDEELVNRLKQAYATIRANGEFDRLRQIWNI